MPYVTLAPNDNTPPLSVHYETWGQRPAPVPTLVLVHELGGTLESLRGFATLLQADCRVIGFDQRGVGLTEKPSAAFTMLDLADDIGRLADALVIPRPFHLLGLAMGAATALQFAARHSDQLASLVLCDGTPEIVESAKRYILDRAAVVRKQGMRTVLEQSFNNAFRGLPDPDGNPEWVAYRHKFLSTPPDSYATHSEALAAMHMEPADFARVRCRTLLLTGQHDFIWPPEVGQDLASRLPNASFEVVDNAAHFPPIQAPHHVAGRVLQFINSSH